MLGPIPEGFYSTMAEYGSTGSGQAQHGWLEKRHLQDGNDSLSFPSFSIHLLQYASQWHETTFPDSLLYPSLSTEQVPNISLSFHVLAANSSERNGKKGWQQPTETLPSVRLELILST